MSTILRPTQLVMIVLLVTFLTTGCTTEVAQTDRVSPVESPQVDQPAEKQPALPADVQVQETIEELWSAIIQQDRKIGNSHEVVRRIQKNGRELIESVSIEKIAIRRQDQTIEMNVVNRFLETPSGGLVSYETKIEQGGNRSSFAGEVSAEGTQLTITTTAGGQSQVAPALPWQPQWGGIYAASQLLQNPPIQPGQTRETTALVPTINQACQIQYIAGKLEPVKLLDGSEVELLSVSNVISLRDQPLMTIPLWVDLDGNTVKMAPPGPDMVIYRCTQEFAESPIEAIQFDLAAETIVQMPEPLDGVHSEKTSAEYLITLKKQISPTLFPASGGQWTSDLTQTTLHLHRIAVRPDTPLPPPLTQQTPPTDADLAASSLVQVDDPLVRQMAALAKMPDDQTWKLGVELEGLVNRSIQQKDFSQAFASAAEVAKSKTGDCTEHAVLLIALLRAHKIPARAAVGLVYYDGKSGRGFAYHMWTEAWINDRWIPLDATLGRGGIGVGHIKIADSDLAGGGALAAFLPVTQVIGNIEIKPLSIN